MSIAQTNYQFPDQKSFYRGKVRDVYAFEDKLVMVATDRISAFDHILPRPIDHKGQVLNQTAGFFLEATRHLVPNWLEAQPHPNVSIGKKCEPIKLEMVIRGYLAGHAWRTYHSGESMLCGVEMPSGMRESDRFPEPIITPATKADEGHDEDISAEQLLEQGIVTEETWNQLSTYTRALFDFGSKEALKQGLLLVDTKYEFGIHEGEICLIDEVHTPDSSRYYYADGYEMRQTKGERQRQLSKEFVREWLMSEGFQGLVGQQMPTMPDEFAERVTARYIELYETITGEKFVAGDAQDPLRDIEESVNAYLAS